MNVVKDKNMDHDYTEQGAFITDKGGYLSLVVLCPFDHVGLENSVPLLSSHSHSLCVPFPPLGASQWGSLYPQCNIRPVNIR